ncbi:hypothetical protein GCM10027610_024670 [Dactylosporangium cerinum]
MAGEALEGIPLTTDRLAATARRFEDRRLTAVEHLIDARIESGRHAETIGELQTWIATHPLRERLWEQLMLAMYRDGRQADALAAYQRLRERLIEDVGVEPSPSVRALQSRILAADPALATPHRDAPDPVSLSAGHKPRQLPLDVATFVGRDDELTRARPLLDPQGDYRPQPVLVIHGAPGVGKAAFAVRLANLSSASFPDGQLYVNLHGATPGVAPVPASEALGRWLRTLGIAATDLPHDVEERAALFRSLVADRRMLILLDNAATADSVRPLLPGSPGTAVVITSRAGLAILDGSLDMHLGPLSPQASRAMLDKLIGPARTTREPEATQRLAALCDFLPLALHLAAARLKARPSWTVSHLVSRLLDERHRLVELATGDVGVRCSLSVGCTALRDSADPDDRAAAQAFCLLGALRVTHFHLELGEHREALQVLPDSLDRAQDPPPPR